MVESLATLTQSNQLGRPREVELRGVWDAIQYIASAGCAWSLLSKDFPPVSTVRYYFYGWRNNGLLAEVNRELVALGAKPKAEIVSQQRV